MSFLRVTPDQLRQLSSQLNGGAGNIEGILSQLGTATQSAAADWQGAAQARFQELWQAWQRSATELHQTLTSMSQLMNQAAQSYQTTEESIATSFGRGV